MTIGTRDQFKRAIVRARELQGWRHVTALGNGRHEVLGRRGDAYTVTVDADGEYACTCPAGRAGTPCWHQASVWIVAVQRSAFRPLAPAPVTVTPGTRLSAALFAQRPSGRGIGISPADLDDDDDLPTPAEQLAALGHKAAA